MKVAVTQLYKNGKKIPRDKKAPVFIGDLSMVESRNAVLNRLVVEAMLHDGTTLVMDALADARVIGIHAHGMLIRGIEYLSGKEVAQEWWVRFGHFVGHPQQYKHYKGGIYDLICEAKLESDPSATMIVYRAEDGTIWSRPSDVFFELVEFEGKPLPRFAPI